MKKRTKILCGLMALAVALASFVGCGKQQVDLTGTIVIEPFANSSFGLNWIENLGKKWQEDTGNQFKILVKKNSTNLSITQLEGIEVSNTDIYFGSEAMYNSGFYKGYFENLSDLLDQKPDGESGLTVREKVYDWEKWNRVSSIVKYNKPTETVADPYAAEYFSYEGCYMLPYSTTFTGILYDHELFVDQDLMAYAETTEAVKSALIEQGISYTVAADDTLIYESSEKTLNYEKGDVILTAGKDGKYGTYDDGQPQTMAEFEVLCNKIMAKGYKPFLYSDTAEYVTQLFYSYIFQKGGQDVYNAIVSFDTNGNEITLKDGSKKVITTGNGYLSHSVSGIEEAAQFVKKYFIDGTMESRYYTTTTSAADERDEFVTNTSKKQLQMVVEGDWFVTGARDILYENNREPADVDYRFMLLPEIDGQKGISGNEHGSVVCAPEAGGIVVRKQADENKLAAIKSFLLYMLKNDTLSWITSSTGLSLNYNYTITDSDYANMSRFSKTCYEILHDSANVKNYSYSVDKMSNPVKYTAKDIDTYGIMPFGNRDSVSLITTLKGGMTGAKLAETVAGNYTAEQWASFLADMESMLGA